MPEREVSPFGLGQETDDEVFNPVLTDDEIDEFPCDEVNINYESLICVDENDSTENPINERLASLLKKNWTSEKSNDALKTLFESINHQKTWKLKFPK